MKKIFIYLVFISVSASLLTASSAMIVGTYSIGYGCVPPYTLVTTPEVNETRGFPYKMYERATLHLDRNCSIGLGSATPQTPPQTIHSFFKKNILLNWAIFWFFSGAVCLFYLQIKKIRRKRSELSL